MNRHRSGVIGAIFTILLTLVGGADGVSAATSGSSSNVSGNMYTSPDYGYSISWDSTWEVSDESVSAGYNMIALDNGASTVYLEGVDSAGSADDCVASVVSALKKGSGVSGVAILTQDDGTEVSGSSPERSYAVYQFTYAGSAGTVDYNEYIDCRPIETGVSMLAITDLVVADKFTGEIDPLLKLLDNLEANGGGVTTGGGEGNGGNATGGNSSAASAGSLASFIKATEVDIDGFWKREFPLIKTGGTYQDPAQLVTFDAAIDTGCGPIKASDVGDVGPFYCPSDNIIYYDLKFAALQLKQFDNNRSVIAVAMAHEIGHHVQEIAGWKECSDTPCLDPQEMTSQEIELQADCFAGAWTADAEGRGRLGSFDVETNIAQFALLLGDQSGGASTADAGAHGNGALRTYWFLGGYYKGATECLTVSAATDPNRNGDSIAATPAAGNSGDLNDPSGTTPTPTATADSGTSVAIGEKFSVALSDATAEAAITGTDVRASVADGVDAQGEYLIVYFNVYTGAKGGSTFDFSTFTVTDSDGKTHQADPDASDAYLKTSPDFPDGTSTVLDASTTYNLAVVYDVPASASGFTVATSDGGVTVTLDR